MQAFYLYDSECPLCVRFKSALDKYLPDEKVKGISVYDDKIYESFPQLNKEECLEVIHLVTEDGKVLKANEAISYLATLHPKVGQFSWLIESGVGLKASKHFYNSLTQIRQSLKKPCPKCKKRENDSHEK